MDKIIGLAVFLVFLTIIGLAGNAIAQKIYPTLTGDDGDRRFSFGLLSRLIQAALFFGVVGFFWLLIQAGVIR